MKIDGVDYSYDPRKDDGTGPKSRGNFKPFYDTDFVKTNAEKTKWTTSLTDKKMPIDMGVFEESNGNAVVGAKVMGHPSLVSLGKLLSLLPEIGNHTFYLDALTDGYCVLDIEPKCPEEVKQELLKMNFDYAETSMSGKGIHLIFPLPDCINNYPNAMSKVRMQEEHGWYEILLNHHITFTRNTMDVEKGDEPFEPFFEEMCKRQKAVVSMDYDIEAERPEDVPFYEEILLFMKTSSYKKTPEDFDNDISRYEFAVSAFLYKKMIGMMHCATIQRAGYEYDENEKSWLIYEALVEKLDHRDKHDEYRDGLPYLLYTARNVVARKDAEQKKEE